MNYVSLALEKQPFQSKSEMDAAIKLHLGEYGSELSDTTIEVLYLISRYACKYPGVAFLKNVSIAKLIGKSRRTIIRVMKCLEDTGIIEKVTVMREFNGGNGANLYVIKPYKQSYDTPKKSHRQEASKPTESRTLTDNAETEPISLLNSKSSTLEIRSNGTVSGAHNKPLYRQFKDFVSNFIPNDKHLLYRLYGVFKAQTKPLESVYNSELLTEVAIESLRAMFSATKVKKLRNPVGYYSGVVKKKLDSMYEELIAEMYGL